VTVCVPRSARVWPQPRRDVVRTALAQEDVTVLAGIPVTTPLVRRLTFDGSQTG
jgi:hypothetical protein